MKAVTKTIRNKWGSYRILKMHKEAFFIELNGVPLLGRCFYTVEDAKSSIKLGAY